MMETQTIKAKPRTQLLAEKVELEKRRVEFDSRIAQIGGQVIELLNRLDSSGDEEKGAIMSEVRQLEAQREQIDHEKHVHTVGPLADINEALGRVDLVQIRDKFPRCTGVPTESGGVMCSCRSPLEECTGQCLS